jgi:hypothetical protein
MKALAESAKISCNLRKRLERCDAKRFHLHRTLMRVRWELDNTPSRDLREALNAILSESGYSALESEAA